MNPLLFLALAIAAGMDGSFWIAGLCAVLCVGRVLAG